MASNAVLSEAPRALSAKYVGSFAYLTVKDRLPTILTKVIDTIHRNRNQFFEEYGEEGVQAEKRAISFLSKLRNELQTDKPIVALADNAPDADSWNQYLQKQQALMDQGGPASWFRSPWLYVECYLYRRMWEALLLNPPISGFDIFKEAKTQAYFESQQAVMAICTHLHDLVEGIGKLVEPQLCEEFLKLLQVSLWGNRCDLSISAGKENSQKSSPIDSLEDLKPFILVDDSNMVWSVLMKSKVLGGESQGRVDFILDNAGFELVTDLVLADFLVSSGLAREIHFHGKSMPWFVSDTTREDFEWTIKQMSGANHGWTCWSGTRWQQYLSAGVWSYHDHPFWTLPHEFCHMATEAPDLHALLQGAKLIFFKGDLNYRKLTGDRAWDYSVTFRRALRGFDPAPLCSLRTLKADVQVGLQPGQGEELTAREADWMTSGKYAVVQFLCPHKEQ
ncbi:damage-control phosphatase ARMT1 [Scleropages formosus]|nr:protein-glutamate O-methyltransferase [Scleropages formosus]